MWIVCLKKVCFFACEPWAVFGVQMKIFNDLLLSCPFNVKTGEYYHNWSFPFECKIQVCCFCSIRNRSLTLMPIHGISCTLNVFRNHCIVCDLPKIHQITSKQSCVSSSFAVNKSRKKNLMLDTLSKGLSCQSVQ